jgi:glycosyltransferase involved in cell wall biosynthesis
MRLPIALDYRPAVLSRSGIGRAVRELARALARRDDVGVRLFAHSLAPARTPTIAPPGARLCRLPIPGRALPALARLGLGADRLVGGARVFHWTDYVHPPVSTARLVLTVHDLAFVREPAWHGPDAAPLRARTAAAIAAAAAVVAPSQATADDVRAFAPGVRKLAVIPFGADHAPTSPLPTEDFVLCLGTIEPRKNHRALLRAWPLLPAPRPRLVVVGRQGWESADVAAELRAAETAGWLAWRRDADDATTWDLLRRARALAYPSLWEGFGFPPLEAMAAGVPVVAHDCAPLRELGGDAFAFADARDPQQLAAALQRALHDAAFRAHAAAAGPQRALRFRWDQCAAAHAALYREVAAC